MIESSRLSQARRHVSPSRQTHSYSWLAIVEHLLGCVPYTDDMGIAGVIDCVDRRVSCVSQNSQQYRKIRLALTAS